ncbi:hotdog fold thioesterase [Mesobacillus subterraneus]|uniref:Hotdog fold thioesterase n=1 Tax=Mesobacillus subterraneus TaxID=285983 RepID=A0A427TM29_9BACI|nr:hotdog fold thioesterase [Mesobacillus subterraneus]RSD25414.1 hotdog fold thioesterase [Mesobacillus subterraneus]
MEKNMSETEIHLRYKAKIIEVLERDSYAKSLGIRLSELGPGSAKSELLVQDGMLNMHGTLHGAVTFALADFAFQSACNSYGRMSVGLTTTVNYMAAGQLGSVVTAKATEERKNYRTAWYKIAIESNGELISTMEATAYRKEKYFVPED